MVDPDVIGILKVVAINLVVFACLARRSTTGCLENCIATAGTFE